MQARLVRMMVLVWLSVQELHLDLEGAAEGQWIPQTLNLAVAHCLQLGVEAVAWSEQFSMSSETNQHRPTQSCCAQYQADSSVQAAWNEQDLKQEAPEYQHIPPTHSFQIRLRADRSVLGAWNVRDQAQEAADAQDVHQAY